MSDIKRIDIEEFRKLGYLHEVNRLWLHPRGLALEMTTGYQEKDVRKIVEELHLGPREEQGARALIKHLGLDRPHLGGVWDYRDDPEGMCFGEIDLEKMVEPEKEFLRHVEARTKLFGGPIQKQDHQVMEIEEEDPPPVGW